MRKYKNKSTINIEHGHHRLIQTCAYENITRLR